MNIVIGDYRISRADDLNLVVEEKREVKQPCNPNLVQKNSHKYYFIGFTANLEQALNKVASKMSNNIEANNLEECLAELQKINSVIKLALNKVDSTTAGTIMQSYGAGSVC